MNSGNQKRAAQADAAATAQMFDDAQRQAQIDQAVQQAVTAQTPAAAAPAAPAGATGGPSMLDQLNDLASLKESGLLTDDEFAAAKAKLLG